MIYRATHESSMIKSSVYDTETSSLTVTFNGDNSYIYEAVSYEDYELFMNGESTGKAFNEFIRKYNGSKLEDSINEVVENEFNEANNLNENA